MSRVAPSSRPTAISTLLLTNFVGDDGKTSAPDIGTLNRWAAEVQTALIAREQRGTAHTLRARLSLEEIASSFTEGSIPFAAPGGALTQDNANLFWDDTNNRLGIGTASPDVTLQVNGTIAPETSAQDLGTSLLRWDAFLEDVDINDDIALGTGTVITWGADVVLDRSAANTLRLATGDSFIPQTSGQDLGATGTRWDLFAANIDATGAVDLNAATSLIVPVAAGAAPTASGSIAYDSTANALQSCKEKSNPPITSGVRHLASASVVAGRCFSIRRAMRIAAGYHRLLVRCVVFHSTKKILPTGSIDHNSRNSSSASLSGSNVILTGILGSGMVLRPIQTSVDRD